MAVHMIGIGGSSMSGLAKLLVHRGFTVRGSDRARSHKTDELSREGIPVTVGHQAHSVDGADLIVYTAAIPEDNVERVRGRALGIPEMERADLLGQLTDEYEKTIAVAGTHGKSTVTAMLAQAFLGANADPTVHIGGVLPLLGGSVRPGKGEHFITEACEFAGSFLKLTPWIAIVLNIDGDHLDYYKTIDNIEAAFAAFVARVRPGGYGIGDGDDPRVLRVLKNAACQSITYGFLPHNDVTCQGLELDDLGYASMTVQHHGRDLFPIKMRVPGEHNARNALAVISVAIACGLPLEEVREALALFSGVHRRFELTGVVSGVKLYHDYGHNPNEFSTVVPLAKRIPHHKFWCVLQPHTYSRTKALFYDFAPAFLPADEVIITDIFARNEKDPGDIHATQLVADFAGRGIRTTYCATFEDARKYLTSHWSDGDVVLTLGCGDIDRLNEMLAE